MTDIRLLQADGGKAKRFSVHRDGKEIAGITTRRPMSADEVRGLFDDEKPTKRGKT